MPCDHSVRVWIDGRHFIVEYDSDGCVLRIKERKDKKLSFRGVPIGVCDVSYWVAKHHALGKGDTLPKRIIEAARAKTDKENAAHNATP